MKALQFSVTVPQFAALKVLGSIIIQFYYDGPLATVRLRDVPEPRLPSPDWVKIKTSVCGLCGSDMNLIMLKESPTASPFTSFPCTLGHEISGEIVEAGNNVSGIGIGDVVTVAPYLSCSIRGIEPQCGSCQAGRPGNCENFAEGDLAPGMFGALCRDIGGGFAPYVVAHKDQVFRLPDEMSPVEGAMIEPFACALQTVLDNMPGQRENVLVIGSGVIGSLIVQAIRAFDIGCFITVAEPSQFHAELVSRVGADHLITNRDILRNTERITEARAYKPLLGKDILMGGFSKVYDTVGNSETVNLGMRALKTGGVLSLVGIEKEVKLDPTPLWLKLQTIKGAYTYGYSGEGGQRRHVFEMAIDYVTQKRVNVESMVTHTFALKDYKRMIEVNLNKPQHRAVKTVVAFS
ncbi:MAG: alcohol dehydrogenase catalytic domain-containing protein [Dehalococcoidia bacterium]|nr:MAG: alcohol dehydrogenase catalytic domain-containing protein [Dehalococcoidia bacterium]